MSTSRDQNNHRGRWARQVCPPWLYTYYDCAERLGLSVSRTKVIVRRSGVPTGLIKRRVRLANGVIRTRSLRVLTPTALRTVLLLHAGILTHSLRKEAKHEK